MEFHPRRGDTRPYVVEDAVSQSLDTATASPIATLRDLLDRLDGSEVILVAARGDLRGTLEAYEDMVAIHGNLSTSYVPIHAIQRVTKVSP